MSYTGNKVKRRETEVVAKKAFQEAAESIAFRLIGEMVNAWIR